MLRGIAAVVVGYVFMTATAVVGRIVSHALFIPAGPNPGAVPTTLPPAFIASNLVAGAFGAVVAGWLTARMATSAPFAHAVVLALMVTALSVVAALSAVSVLPAWYGVAISAIGVLGVLVGGWLRAAAGEAPRA